MALNLRDRLKRINDQKNTMQKTEDNEQGTENKEHSIKKNKEIDLYGLKEYGWEVCGYKVLKRVVKYKSSLRSKKINYSSLSVIIPDLKNIKIQSPEDFIFFDLETTGLSTGSGTVAFLSAFARIVSGTLHITQYLLLDYPGQNDFLENILSHLKNEKSVIVSFNGKSYDSHILKTMCIINRIKPPEYQHADLLHPSRRLWKRIIGDCSQSSIEAKILNIDRENDIQGSLAPEIWFDFLKTGKTERLIGICDHNVKDIIGLSSILTAMINIADNPFDEKYRYDIERLALYWRKNLRKKDTDLQDDALKKTGDKLLQKAAENNSPFAVYIYAYDQLKKGNYEESLKFIRRGLKLFKEETKWHQILTRRKERLKKLIKK